ncbi:MAG: molybdenum cofactor guanylyltransferase [Propionibacteriaceae bacterium]|nr:molybdenum cofactor guanylyltransferase [Propionibacteriaceae bacterium]
MCADRSSDTQDGSLSWVAVILAGGRAERLGGYDKSTLVGPDGCTSVDRVLDACTGASRMVVVGPQPADGSEASNGNPGVRWTREQPVFSGPARAICAGLAALGADNEADVWVAVFGCDMPNVGEAVSVLLKAAAQAGPDIDGVVAESGGHLQWLCALYRRTALTSACAQLPVGGSSESVGRLVGRLTLAGQPVPGSSVQDIDTPTDMRTLGFRPAPGDRPAA